MEPVQQGQAAEQQVSRVWIAADYHFPSTYSCRIPMSSMNSASAMPAPGPATVRLALIRTGIELFGRDRVRDELFPILRSAAVRIRPPERVAISQQRIRGYKWSQDRQKRETIQESIIVREMAHARGLMTVFLQVPLESEQRMHRLLRAIGYWGQSSLHSIAELAALFCTHQYIAFFPPSAMEAHIMQWKPLSCNGKVHIVQRKSSHRAMES